MPSANVTPLPIPITVGQTPLPMQLCYIVPADAPALLLDAVFAECYARWGGRDTLLLPLHNGAIDERYWAWARAFDPDVVYSYAPLDEALLARIDRDLMPSAVEQHWNDDKWHPHFREAPAGLHALSLLPYLANNRRMGPPRPLGLVTAYQGTTDPFVADSFGIAPFGPGMANADDVRRYVETIAVRDRPQDPHRSTASEDVSDAQALLALIPQFRYEMLTMAQLSAMGYDAYRHRLTPAWDAYNIIVGDTTADRIAFWNARVGCEPYLRSQIIALRVPEARLDDASFLAALTEFIARTNYPRGSALAHAVIRSASVSEERLRPLIMPLAQLSVHASVALFSDLADCVPTTESRWPAPRDVDAQRYTDSPIALRPLQPAHLAVWPVLRPPLTSGAWALRTTFYRDVPSYSGTDGELRMPRRWASVEATLSAVRAKPTHAGAWRVLVTSDTPPLTLALIVDDDRFVRHLFADYTFHTRTEPRTVLLPHLPHARVAISNAGRQLLGFLTKIGNLRDAFALIDDPFWKVVFTELAGPLGGASDDVIAANAATIKKWLKGKTELTNDEDYRQLADMFVRLAPDLKVPRPRQRFSWFLERYREHGDLEAHLLAQTKGERELHDHVSVLLTECCSQGIFHQGHTWKCDNCDHANWTPADRLETHLACGVCRERQALAADFEWRFLLDEAIMRGMREQGLRSLMWALGALRGTAEHAFLFSPPLDLWLNNTKLTDLDIACVIDGRFVIGEAKDSDRGFTPAKSDQLVAAARAVRPDAVILACPNPAAVPTVNAQVAYIKAQLADTRIDVRALLITAEIRQRGIPTTITARHFWRTEPVQIVRVHPTPIAAEPPARPA